MQQGIWKKYRLEIHADPLFIHEKFMYFFSKVRCPHLLNENNTFL